MDYKSDFYNKVDLVKVNNVNELYSSSTSRVNCENVYDLTNKSKYTGIGRDREKILSELIIFYNKSRWLVNEKAKIKLSLKVKKKSYSLSGWIDSQLNRLYRDEENKVKLKDEVGRTLVFTLDKIDFDLFNPTDNYLELRERFFCKNVFNFIREFSKNKLIDESFIDELFLSVVNTILKGEVVDYKVFTSFMREAYSKCVSISVNSVLQGLDIDDLIISLNDHIAGFHNLAVIISESNGDILLKNNSEVYTFSYSTMLNILNEIYDMPAYLKGSFQYTWEGFSTGELAKLNIFSLLYDFLNDNNLDKNRLIVIDEVDLYLHPEWQRLFLSDLISFVSNNFTEYNLQFLITSHSPLIISDFLPEDIVSLGLDEDGKVQVVDSYGFGTEVTDAYLYGMHISSTYGEHSREKLLELIEKKEKSILTEDDVKLANKINNKNLRKVILDD